MTVKPLAIDLIQCGGGTQMRAELSVDVYMDYRDKILAGVEFPPLDVFYDGSEYWLADGFHRFYGHREAKKASVKCTVHNGTVRDAILFAVGANASHGLNRSREDKRNAVRALLNDETWVKWSDKKIAEQAAVGADLVGTVRKELSLNDSSPAAKTKDEPKIGKDGKARKAPTKPTKPKPQASVTGSGNPSESASPDLPSVGTANRTESGSQDSGDAGECPKEDYGKCPNCAGTKWIDDEFGVSCSKCKHPHGEPAGEVDDQRISDARSKTIKTAEALMRAFDDLNLLVPHAKEHANAILQCKFLLKEAREWK